MKRDDHVVELFRDQRAGLWKFFLSGAGSADVAEDLLQETFMRLWEHRESLESELGSGNDAGLRRWIWRVARNRMIDEIRARQRTRARSASLESQPAAVDASDASEDFRRRQTVGLVREVVAAMPNERSRRCLSLWLADRTLTDIARETGLRRGQVRGLLQRAKQEVVGESLRRMKSPAGKRGGRG